MQIERVRHTGRHEGGASFFPDCVLDFAPLIPLTSIRQVLHDKL